MTLRSQYRWPAEWEPQAAVWIAWPHNVETWPGRFAPVPAAFARFIRTVAEVTPVRVLAGTGETAGAAAKHLSGVGRVDLVPIATDDCWVRDYGPTFVVDAAGRLHGVDWTYNAWGGKYPPWDQDAAAGERICRAAGAERLQPPGGLCLEGGAIETDGRGTLLTAPECVVTATRNPGLSRSEAERVFADLLGIREVVWLAGGGLRGDDTDGHIDQLARFVSPDHLVVATCADPADPNHAPLEANHRQLADWGAARGVHVHRLPLPPPRAIDGQPVPQGYCNFLITGGLVLVPTFGARDADARALAILRELCPGHDVIGLDASDLVWGLGAFHCASQQQPQGRAASTDAH